jgi:D-lactate dehydrogenase
MRRLLASPAARRLGFAAYTGGAIYLGWTARRADNEQSKRALPSGWRACCEGGALTAQQAGLPDKLSGIVGPTHVERFVEQRGARIGQGVAFVVVRPGTIAEAVDALQACVDADVCVVPQGANTGLTGASVPRGVEAGVDRPTVVLSLTRLDHVMPIDNGERMVCLAGAGIHSVLQKAQARRRESHSVLGSIFLNPTTAAGVALGSGGTQLRKGPVFTERVLYARVNGDGKVELVNTLGLKAADGEAALLSKLSNGAVSDADVQPHCALAASQTSYARSVCACDGHDGRHVARYNASTCGPEPNRSEGKVLILASVHDTFPKPARPSTLWLSVPDLATAQQLKRDVCLGGGPAQLPTSCEYMDRDAVTAVDEAGRVLCWMISFVGIGHTLKQLWDVKIRFEALPIPFAPILADKARPITRTLRPLPVRSL